MIIEAIGETPPGAQGFSRCWVLISSTSNIERRVKGVFRPLLDSVSYDFN
jgi:hypothetical protein